MKEKWPVSKIQVLFAAAVVLAVMMLCVVLFANRAREEPEGTETAANSQSVSQPTAAPTEVKAEENVTEEPAEEATSGGEPASPEEPVNITANMVEYVSVTEFFSVMVPDGWPSQETFPGGAFVMANSSLALDLFNSNGTVGSGNLVLNIGFLPFELFRQREIVPINVQFEAAPDVFMQSIMPVFNPSGETVLGQVELVSLDDDRDAGMMSVSDSNREGLILMFMAGDEVVAVVSAVGFPGEIDTFTDTIFNVADGVTFNGNQGALFGSLLEG